MCIGFWGGTSGKEPAYQSGDIRDTGLIPGSGRSPERGILNTPSALDEQSRGSATLPAPRVIGV